MSRQGATSCLAPTSPPRPPTPTAPPRPQIAPPPSAPPSTTAPPYILCPPDIRVNLTGPASRAEVTTLPPATYQTSPDPAAPTSD